MSNIFSQLVSQRAFRLVNNMTQSPALAGVKVVSVSIRYNSQLLSNRKESGQMIIDGRVILPVEISMNVLCDSLNAVDVINQVLGNQTDTYTLYSRGITVDNVSLNTEVMSQKAAVMSAHPMTLTFKQALLQSQLLPACLQSGDATTFLGGIRNTISVSQEKFAQLQKKFMDTLGG